MERVAPGDQTCDVLVVGSGGAGLRAALAAAAAPGTRVLVATKGHINSSGVTALACSDRMAFHATLPHTEPVGPDAWRYHAEDVFRIGGGVSDWDLAEILARESAAAFDYLDSLGVPFVKQDELADQFLTDGSVYARACYTGPHTANHIHQALLRRLAEEPVGLIESCLVAEIAVTPGRQVAGVVAVDVETGRTFTICAGAVVVATGGAGEVYETHVFPPGMTGDGYALALRAGCSLANAEFVQLGLCSTATKLACSGSLMRALPRLVDEEGREFLLEYFPTPRAAYDTLFQKGASWPVSYEHDSRLIDVAVSQARARGRRVFLDFSANPTALDLGALDYASLARFANVAAFYGGPEAAVSPLVRLQAINPESIAWLRERGINLEAGDRIEIAPSAQHFQGGVRIRRDASAELSGLFAAGECAGGQHGANRPGGHSLLDGQVFGRIAGESAAAWAPEQPAGARECHLALVGAGERLTERLQERGAPASEVRRRVKALVDRAAGVVRTADGLAAALKEVRRIRAGGIALDAEGRAFDLETQNLALVAEALLAAALARRESRGPHLRFAASTDTVPLGRDDTRYQRMSSVRLRCGTAQVDFVRPVTPRERSLVERWGQEHRLIDGSPASNGHSTGGSHS